MQQSRGVSMARRSRGRERRRWEATEARGGGGDYGLRRPKAAEVRGGGCIHVLIFLLKKQTPPFLNLILLTGSSAPLFMLSLR